MPAGRIRTFPLTLETGYHVLHTPEESARITHHSRPLHALPCYLLLSKKIARNQELPVRFNRGLKRLKESGRYEQYIQETARGAYLNKK